MIIRTPKNRDNPYVMANRSWILDNRLSWKARGIMIYLVSLPDDWKIYLEELTKHTTDGLKATTSGIHELIEKGYMSRETIRDDKGRFKGYEYLISEVSSEMPKTENGKTENGKTEIRKRQATNKELKLNNNFNKGPANNFKNKTQNQNQRLPNYANFEQREYDEKEIEQFVITASKRRTV